MKESETLRIRSDPDPVWSYIGHPERWPEFHDKLRSVQCEHVRPGGLILAELEFRGRPMSFEGEIIRLESHRIIVARLVETPSDQPNPPQLTVAYGMERPRGKIHIRVTESVEFDFQAPWILRLLIQALMRFGRKQGPSNLDRLKSLLEQRS